MKLVKTSVKRPVGVIMIVLAIIALGTVSLRNLNVDLLPEVDLPIAVVATSYPEAAPEEVEDLISRPVESSVSSIEGIDTVQSQSQSGSSLVMMMFNNGTDLDQAMLDVRESIDKVKGNLPDDAGDPSVLRFNPDQMPVMQVSLTGDDAAKLTQVADDQIVPFLERQNGVASVNVEGSKEREIQLELDQAKLQQYGVTADSISQALQNSNQSSSAGSVKKGHKDLQLRVIGEFDSIDDIRNTIVPTQSDGTVHVDDVADVKDTYKESSGETMVNGDKAVVLSIMKKNDANTVAVSDTIHDSMSDVEADLPSDVSADVVIDTSDSIRMSIKSVIQNILIGGVISFLILLLFLKSFRASIVIGVSIPIAIISTFSLMYFTGETLNVLTLGGLALGLGMMVDSSIVILEHIYTYRQRGYGLKDAAIKGASELTPAVIASTTTTLVVFLPMIFVEGIASELFAPLAITVSFALVASLIAAITLVPMLSSKLLVKATENSGKRYWFSRLLDRVISGYQTILKWVLGHRKTTVFTTLVVIVGSLLLIPAIGASFIPSSDQGQLQITVKTEAGSSKEHTEDVTEKVNDQLGNYDDVVKTSYLNVGSDASNQASYMMELLPSSERSRSTEDVVQSMTDDLDSVPGADITVQSTDNASGLGDPVQINLSGPEHDVLDDLAGEVTDKIAQVDGVSNPESSAEKGTPQMHIDIDAEKASMYGLSAQQITGQLQLQFTGQTAAKYREDGSEMDVTLMYPKDERSTINDLEDVTIQSESGASVPLTSLVSLEETQGPSTLQREDQQPQLNVTSEVAGRDLGSVTSDIQDQLDSMSFPEGYDYDIGGQAEDMADSFADLSVALIFSIFLVYAVMAVQFENFLFPFVIMFSLPTTIVGVLLGFFVTGLPLSIPAFIGIIMLAGIVVNNSIVLVDYINILRGEQYGKDRYTAIIEAGASRLRPILMTTLTTILAMVPLGLALGEGAEMQQPLAITIIFGLTISSIFTLLFIPVIYTLFDDLTSKITRRKKKAE